MAVDAAVLAPVAPHALSHRRGWADFRRLWAAHSVSTAGDQVTLVALPLVAYSRTGSALAVGVVAAMEPLTAVLFGLLAGAAADRLRHRRVLVATDIARASLLAALAAVVVVPTFPVAVLFLLAFALGALRVLHDAAAGPLLPIVVSGPLLLRANGRMQASESAATAVGPALAGGLISAGGPALALAADAVTFAVSGAAVHRVRALDAAEPAREQRRGRVRSDILDGLRAMWSDRWVMRAVAVAAAINVASVAVEAHFIPFARETLDIGAAGIAAFFTLGGSAAVITSLVVGRYTRVRGDVLVAALAVFAGGVLVAGAYPSLLTAALMYLCAGVGSSLAATHFHCLRQRRFPVHLQGRVAMAARMVTYGLLPVAYVGGGMLARSAGPDALFVTTAAVGLATAAWATAAGLTRLRVD